MKELNEQDLDNLINEKLENNCSGYTNICELVKTPVGKQRVLARVKEMIIQDGITSIEAILAQIETEMRFDS
jgi:hypothetical protein